MDNKKKAAAMAAVFTYIKSSEEYAMHLAAEAEAATADTTQPARMTGPALPAGPVNVWGLAGRQEIM